MQKVWMVWQTVDFGQEWMVGAFSTEAKAEAAMAAMFAEWADDRGTTVDQWKASQAAQDWVLGAPFFVTAMDVQ